MVAQLVPCWSFTMVVQVRALEVLLLFFFRFANLRICLSFFITYGTGPSYIANIILYISAH